MTYVRYANFCAAVVRASLKEPFAMQAKARERVYYKGQQYVDGRPKAEMIVEVAVDLPKK